MTDVLVVFLILCFAIGCVACTGLGFYWLGDQRRRRRETTDPLTDWEAVARELGDQAQEGAFEQAVAANSLQPVREEDRFAASLQARSHHAG